MNATRATTTTTTTANVTVQGDDTTELTIVSERDARQSAMTLALDGTGKAGDTVSTTVTFETEESFNQLMAALIGARLATFGHGRPD